MLLETIHRPADLRGLDHDELTTLATEIRSFIVQATSVTGGHLGSNLGVVELTLALHRVFDSPRDILLWDAIAVARDHWRYNPRYVTGWDLPFSVPVEELVFFLVIPLCGLLTFETVRNTLGRGSR